MTSGAVTLLGSTLPVSTNYDRVDDLFGAGNR